MVTRSLQYLVQGPLPWRWSWRIVSDQTTEYWFRQTEIWRKSCEMGARFCNVKHLKYDWGRAFDFGEIEDQLTGEVNGRH